MKPDASNAENAKSDFELDELVGLIGNAYVRRGLSPPSQLRAAVKGCLGLSHWRPTNRNGPRSFNSLRVSGGSPGPETSIPWGPG